MVIVVRTVGAVRSGAISLGPRRSTRRFIPALLRAGELTLPLSYAFEPGTPDDGVAVHVPLAVLNRLRSDGFDRLVPGLREELVTALVRSLPKDLRRAFLPVADAARSRLGKTPAAGRGPPLQSISVACGVSTALHRGRRGPPGPRGVQRVRAPSPRIPSPP